MHKGKPGRSGFSSNSLVKRRAKSDGQLAVNIQPLASIFASRHRAVKKDRPTKVQTRAKAQLKSALALAAKYDVAADAASQPAETNDEP